MSSLFVEGSEGDRREGGGGLPGAVSRMDVGKIHASRVI